MPEGSTQIDADAHPVCGASRGLPDVPLPSTRSTTRCDVHYKIRAKLSSTADRMASPAKSSSATGGSPRVITPLTVLTNIPLQPVAPPWRRSGEQCPGGRQPRPVRGPKAVAAARRAEARMKQRGAPHPSSRSVARPSTRSDTNEWVLAFLGDLRVSAWAPQGKSTVANQRNGG